MKIRKMPWFEFAPDTYEIDEFDCASIFLFVGTERALLLDTGIGIGDLKGLVEGITDKPYDVVLTHGHRVDSILCKRSNKPRLFTDQP